MQLLIASTISKFTLMYFELDASIKRNHELYRVLYTIELLNLPKCL